MVANARASASDKSNATVANASACSEATSEAITASINACTSTKGNSGFTRLSVVVHSTVG